MTGSLIIVESLLRVLLLLLLLLLSRFSRVQLCATPERAAHQAPWYPGFSRQEHWSGLPFPSPMHESEKWKWSSSVVSDSSWPHGLQPTRLPRPWDFPGKSTGVGCHCLLQLRVYISLFVSLWADGCLGLPHIPHALWGRYDHQTQTKQEVYDIGTVLSYKCHFGYKPETDGPTTVTCQSNLKWSPYIECKGEFLFL